jgi:hypothetical protein
MENGDSPGTSSRNRLLLPDKLPPLEGPARVALHSLLRISCEANQLSINDVIRECNIPILRPSDRGGHKLIKSLHLIDAGSVLSERIIGPIEDLTGFKDLHLLTLSPLVKLDGVGRLSVAEYRKWCPYCYCDDVTAGLPPYDRLLWSIKLVNFCPVHDVPLLRKCRSCGGDRTPLRYGRDLSGFCPHCFSWLGEGFIPRKSVGDDQTSHARWVTRSLESLLNQPPEEGTPLLVNFQHVIRDLASQHHAGAVAHVAHHIRRNRSVTASWLSGASQPAWDAICDISYVYQQPLPLMLRGQVCELLTIDPLPLPATARPRQGERRKRPVPREHDKIRGYLTDLAKGAHPSITSLAMAARKIGIEVREFYSIAPDSASDAARALNQRKKEISIRTTAQKHASLAEGMQIAARRLASVEAKITRRVVCAELEKLGLRLRWAETKLVVQQVRRLAAEAGYRASNSSTVSGNT